MSDMNVVELFVMPDCTTPAQGRGMPLLNNTFGDARHSRGCGGEGTWHEGNRFEAFGDVIVELPPLDDTKTRDEIMMKGIVVFRRSGKNSAVNDSMEVDGSLEGTPSNASPLRSPKSVHDEREEVNVVKEGEKLAYEQEAEKGLSYEQEEGNEKFQEIEISNGQEQEAQKSHKQEQKAQKSHEQEQKEEISNGQEQEAQKSHKQEQKAQKSHEQERKEEISNGQEQEAQKSHEQEQEAQKSHEQEQKEEVSPGKAQDEKNLCNQQGEIEMHREQETNEGKQEQRGTESSGSHPKEDSSMEVDNDDDRVDDSMSNSPVDKCEPNIESPSKNRNNGASDNRGTTDGSDVGDGEKLCDRNKKKTVGNETETMWKLTVYPSTLDIVDDFNFENLKQCVFEFLSCFREDAQENEIGAYRKLESVFVFGNKYASVNFSSEKIIGIADAMKSNSMDDEEVYGMLEECNEMEIYCLCKERTGRDVGRLMEVVTASFPAPREYRTEKVHSNCYKIVSRYPKLLDRCLIKKRKEVDECSISFFPQLYRLRAIVIGNESSAEDVTSLVGNCLDEKPSKTGRGRSDVLSCTEVDNSRPYVWEYAIYVCSKSVEQVLNGSVIEPRHGLIHQVFIFDGDYLVLECNTGNLGDKAVDSEVKNALHVSSVHKFGDTQLFVTGTEKQLAKLRRDGTIEVFDCALDVVSLSCSDFAIALRSQLMHLCSLMAIPKNDVIFSGVHWEPGQFKQRFKALESYDQKKAAQVMIQADTMARLRTISTNSKLKWCFVGRDLSSAKPTGLDSIHVRMVNQDCLVVANKLRKRVGDDPVIGVLNMANETYCGGGYKNGAMAQEEELFRRTNLVLALEKDIHPIVLKLRNEVNPHPPSYPWRNPTAITASNVTCFRAGAEDGYQLLQRPFEMSIISVAAVKDPKLEGDSYEKPEDVKAMAFRINLVLRAAVEEKVDHLVLSALGCGAFHNPPEEVSKIFRILLSQYIGYFRSITFAILDTTREKRNISAFEKEFAQPLNTKKDCLKTMCRDFGECKKFRNEEHSKNYGHFECHHSRCREIDNIVHRSLFVHICPRGGTCDVTDRKHNEIYLHPNLCAQGGRCTDFTKEHCERYRHPQECRFESKCPDITVEHQNRYRHRMNLCKHGFLCRKVHDTDHMDQECHPFARPSVPFFFGHENENTYICPHGWNCRHWKELLKNEKPRGTSSPGTHIMKYVHFFRKECDSNDEVCPLKRARKGKRICKEDAAILEMHLWEYAHSKEDIRDIRILCKYGSGCKDKCEIRHIMKYAHPLTHIFATSSFQDVNRNISFAENASRLMGWCKMKERVDEILETVKQFRPVHRLKLEVFESVMQHGYLMALTTMAKLNDANYVGKQARHHYALDSLKLTGEGRTAAANLLEVLTKRSVRKHFGTVDVIDVDAEDAEQKERLAREARLSPDDIDQLKKTAEGIGAASQFLYGERTGIAYAVDHNVETDSSIFSIVGPNTFHRYGEVFVVFRRDIMFHPDFYMNMSAATLYYTQGSLKNRHHIRLPGAPNSPERITFYNQSKLNPAFSGSMFAVALDLAKTLQEKKAGSLSKKELLTYWRNNDAHFVLEGHLPARTSFGAVACIIMPESSYGRMSEDSKKTLRHLFRDDQIVRISDGDELKKDCRKVWKHCIECTKSEKNLVGLCFSVENMDGKSVKLPLSLNPRSRNRQYVRFSVWGDSSFYVGFCGEGDDETLTIKFEEEFVSAYMASIKYVSDLHPDPSEKTKMGVRDLDKLIYRTYEIVVDFPENKVRVKRLSRGNPFAFDSLEFKDKTVSKLTKINVSNEKNQLISVREMSVSSGKPILEEVHPKVDPDTERLLRRSSNRILGVSIEERVVKNSSEKNGEKKGASNSRPRGGGADDTDTASSSSRPGPIKQFYNNVKEFFVGSDRECCDYGTRCHSVFDDDHCKRFSHPHRSELCNFPRTCRILYGSVSSDSEMEKHIKKCVHECQFGQYCTKISDKEHLKHFVHPYRRECSDGMECNKLGDKQHRLTTDHGKPIHPIPYGCRYGKRCSDKHDVNHCRKYSHWTLDEEPTPVQDDERGRNSHSRSGGHRDRYDHYDDRSKSEKKSRRTSDHDDTYRILSEMEEGSGKDRSPTPPTRSTPDVSLCFVMDITSSMASYISNCCSEVVAMAKEVENKANTSASSAGYGERAPSCHFAWIGYRDIEDSNNVVTHPFGAADSLKGFLGYQRAAGGGDYPEDMASGLDAALSQSWENGFRMIVIVADAPNHGYCNSGGDSHPSCDQHGVSWAARFDKIFKKAKEMNIEFAFMDCAGNLGSMISLFEGAMGKCKVKVLIAGSTAAVGDFETRVAAVAGDSYADYLEKL